MRSRLALCCVLGCALLSPLSAAHAQAVLGVQDDALVLPRGVFRLRILNQWTHFNERYGENTPGRPNGSLEPLAIDFNLDTIGTSQFPNLTPVQAGLRSLTGIPDFTLSLGQTVVNSDVSITATPVVFDFGITSRFSVAVNVPYVRTRNTIFFNANPAGREGNVGFNPALASTAAQQANAAVVTALQTRATGLQNTLDACQANPGAAGCAQVNANRNNLQALVNNTTAFAGGIAQLYGTGAAAPSPFIPITNSTAQLAIESRIQAFSALYAQFTGSPAIPTTTVPIGAQARLNVSDAQRILTDPAFGVAADPLQTIERSHIGDIELGMKYLLFDSFVARGTDRLTPSGINWRTAVTGVVRLPTGQQDSPDNFVDVPTGNGQTDIELRAAADILIGRHFWNSFIARYAFQLADDQFMRISDAPEKTLTALYRRQRVERDLGDYYELETNPRWVFNNYFSVTGHYMFRHKAEDQYSGTFDIPAAVTGFQDITLNANTLNQQTEQSEHRLGFGASFSTVAPFAQGKAKIPLEITYLHWQTTRGSGGNIPKAFTDQIQLRVYTRIFGGS
jgi:hypothetical protein